jgi:hypothetical protein
LWALSTVATAVDLCYRQIGREWPMLKCDGQSQEQDKARGITAVTAHYLICALRTL